MAKKKSKKGVLPRAGKRGGTTRGRFLEAEIGLCLLVQHGNANRVHDERPSYERRMYKIGALRLMQAGLGAELSATRHIRVQVDEHSALVESPDRCVAGELGRTQRRDLGTRGCFTTLCRTVGTEHADTHVVPLTLGGRPYVIEVQGLLTEVAMTVSYSYPSDLPGEPPGR